MPEQDPERLVDQPHGRGLYPWSKRPSRTVGVAMSPVAVNMSFTGTMDHHEHADDLLRRALLDTEATAAVALRVSGLPLCEQLTVVFHGRRDLGTIQTYVTHGGRGAGLGGRRPTSCCASRATSTSPPPRTARRPSTCTPSRPRAMRDALVGADTVLDIWREPLGDMAHSRVEVDRRISLGVDLPAHRLLPAALVAPEQADRGDRGVRRPPARRGPPADGHRVRPAGRRARLPAARRPRALPGGLPRRRRRARAPDGRAARPPGGERAALPRAVGRRLPGHG